MPEWQYTIALDYNTQINDRLDVYAHINLNHKDDHYSSQDEGNDAHDLINANVRLAYELSNGRSASSNFGVKILLMKNTALMVLASEHWLMMCLFSGNQLLMGVSMGMNFKSNPL